MFLGDIRDKTVLYRNFIAEPLLVPAPEHPRSLASHLLGWSELWKNMKYIVINGVYLY